MAAARLYSATDLATLNALRSVNGAINPLSLAQLQASAVGAQQVLIRTQNGTLINANQSLLAAQLAAGQTLLNAPVAQGNQLLNVANLNFALNQHSRVHFYVFLYLLV